jgi:NhaP-type Na+/H+ and K+/H+ antiporter
VLGRKIAALNLEDAYDVRVSRVMRAGVELIPTPSLALQFGDILNVIGRPESLRKVAAVIGNKEKRLQQVEYVPLFVGLILTLHVSAGSSVHAWIQKNPSEAMNASASSSGMITGPKSPGAPQASRRHHST